MGQDAVRILREPVTDASAWKASDFVGDDSWIYRLNQQEISELDEATRLTTNGDIVWWELEKETFPLPTLGERLTEIQAELESGRGFVVLRGIPVERYTLDELKALYFGMSSHIGWVLPQNPTGDLVEYVADKGKTYDDIKVRGYETTSRLSPHCDSGDVVGLLCVRNAKEGGESSISSFSSVYNEILANHPEYLEVLYRGFHQNIRGCGPPGPGENVTLHRMPVFTYYKGRLSGRFNAKGMRTGAEWPDIEPLTDLENAAIDCVESLALRDDLRLDMMLQPGDVQLLSNHTVMHTRTGFVDYDDPDRKRLLLRIWVNIPGGRELPEDFADHFNTGPREGPFVREPAAPAVAAPAQS